MDGKSFRDALTEAKTSDGQATIYYASENGTRAVYDVPNCATGEMYLNGRLLTKSDLPDVVPAPEGTTSDDFIYSKNIQTAEVIFSHNQVDVQSGWKTRP